MKKESIFAAAMTLSLFCAACNDAGDSCTAASTRGMTLSVLNDEISRTEFDGTATVWSVDDAVSVFVDGNDAVPYRFEIVDPANGMFRNDDICLDGQVEYAFHAVYPAVRTTELTNGIMLDIGAAEQTQNGTSAEHIAALDPLVGESTAYPSAVAVTMKHTATILKLTFTGADDTANVRSVKIEAPEGVFLYGKHALDLETCETTAITGRSGNATEVKINGSGDSEADGEFAVWAAVAPFEIPAGEKLTFTVRDGKGRMYGIDKTFDDGKEFAAGKIMTTALELSERTMTEEINIGIDFTDPDAYPQGFPEAASQVSSGSYIFSGYAFSLDGDVTYCGQSTTSGWALCFDKFTKDNTVRIGIPRIEGYAPTAVTIGMHPTAVSAQNAKIAVITDNADITTWKYNNQAKIAYELSGTDDVAEYYICIKGNTNAESKCRLSSLGITYGKLP